MSATSNFIYKHTNRKILNSKTMIKHQKWGVSSIKWEMYSHVLVWQCFN